MPDNGELDGTPTESESPFTTRSTVLLVMATQDIAATLLTATGMVFAGSSLLINQLTRRAEVLLEDSEAIEYSNAAFLSMAAGFAFTVVAVFFLTIAVINEYRWISVVPLNGGTAIYLGSLSFLGAVAAPCYAAFLISVALYMTDSDPLQQELP